jgi:integrase
VVHPSAAGIATRTRSPTCKASASDGPAASRWARAVRTAREGDARLVREGARARRRDDEGAIAALVALLLGLRASEIVGLRVADLDDDEDAGDLLWIPCSKTPAGRRTLEVPAELRPLLIACAEDKTPNRYLFECEREQDAIGKPHLRDWVLDQVHRVCDAAKVPRVTAHALRGQLATLTAERGLAGHLIAATLGHEDVRTTMTAYAKPGSAAAGARARGWQVLNGGVQVRPKSAK